MQVRNTGDDGLASWSLPREGLTAEANTANSFRFNSVQLPWRANCFAVYGGRSTSIEDSVCTDSVSYPGLMLSQAFGSSAFNGTTTVKRTTLLRAGGRDHWGKAWGALVLDARDASMRGFRISDVRIDDATYSGIELTSVGAEVHDIGDATFERVRVVNASTWGVHVSARVTGEAAFDQVDLEGSGAGEALIEAVRVPRPRLLQPHPALAFHACLPLSPSAAATHGGLARTSRLSADCASSPVGVRVTHLPPSDGCLLRSRHPHHLRRPRIGWPSQAPTATPGRDRAGTTGPTL